MKKTDDCLQQNFFTQCCNKDFARLTSNPVRGWTGKNKAFGSPGTQNGLCVIKFYCRPQVYLTLSKAWNLECNCHFFFFFFNDLNIVDVSEPFYFELKPYSSWISSFGISKKKCSTIKRNLKVPNQLRLCFCLHTGRSETKWLAKETSECSLDRYNTDCFMQRKIHLKLTWNYFSIIRFVYIASSLLSPLRTRLSFLEFQRLNVDA